MAVEVQRHAPAALPLGKRPGTHCIGGWVGPRARLDMCEKCLLHRDFFCIRFYSVLHPYLVLCCILPFVCTYNTNNTNFHPACGAFMYPSLLVIFATVAVNI